MILHIASDNTKHIIYPFIDFVNQNFNKNEHFYILCSKEKDIKRFENAITKDIFTQTEFFIQEMKKAGKIILHGIWYDKLFEIYKTHPEFFEKTFWNAWGGDFYYERSELHRWFIKHVKHIITYIDGDYTLIKNQYNTNAELIKSFMYPSNMYKVITCPLIKKSKIYVQVGNSADPANNHLEVFKKIRRFKNIKVFCPLVYGDEIYKKKIIVEGKKIFKENFVAITKKMQFNKYIRYLSTIDIAIFNHKRQQAMGNTITLLGFGKKVYLRNDVTQWNFFNDLGIKVFCIDDIEISLLNESIKKKNIKKIKKHFSEENLKKQLKKIFDF